jgi:hypothetical protein
MCSGHAVPRQAPFTGSALPGSVKDFPRLFMKTHSHAGRLHPDQTLIAAPTTSVRRHIDYQRLDVGEPQEWPDRHFVPDAVRDYCMFAVPSSAGGGVIVMGAGGR